MTETLTQAMIAALRHACKPSQECADDECEGHDIYPALTVGDVVVSLEGSLGAIADVCTDAAMRFLWDRRPGLGAGDIANLGDGRLVTHGLAECAGTSCSIHNPSDHHMVGWPQLWRPDRRIIERICEHGTGHPDPDDLTQDTVHGCCGCCVPSHPGEKIMTIPEFTPINRNSYRISDNITSLSEDDADAITDLLMGHKVTKVAKDHLVLDDGTLLRLIGNDGGCTCGAGDYDLTVLNGTDNIITRVELHNSPDGDDLNGEGVYEIFVFADNERINLVRFEGTDGNGYYGTGYCILVQRPVS